MYYELTMQYSTTFNLIIDRLVDHGIPFSAKYECEYPHDCFVITCGPINLKILNDKILINMEDLVDVEERKLQ